jgi:ribose 5-phosphate isomerase A
VVPTSIQTETLCVKSGLNLTNLSEYSKLDLAIDGADQVDVTTLNVLKGAGGALTREKIVARAAKKFVIVVDQEKLVRHSLYERVPVEVVPFGLGFVMKEIARIGGKPTLRESGGKLGPVVTDNGNYIIDADFGKISFPEKLDKRLKAIPGVVETGLFLRMADIVYVGRKDGSVETLKRRKVESVD